MTINKIYYNKIKYSKLCRISICIFILSLIICLSGFYEFNKYKKLINTFKINFDDYKFSEANNLLLTKQNFNPFKSFMINKDISQYLYTKVNILSENVRNKNISSEDALIQLREIQHYNIIADNELHNISDCIDLIQDSSKNYDTGINHFNNEQYMEAIPYFKRVSALDLNYLDSLIYLNNSKNNLKKDLLDYCDNLISNDHYNDALSKISDDSDILGDDINVKEKIIEIKAKQQEYLDEKSAITEASSHALTTTISPTNINNLNIESTTSYFINVNIENQKTYIYKGKADKWQLVRTCACSTGISGEDTPSGSFSSQEKGDWFFSDKYKEGGKYWTQITGDILFHSVPFAKDKNTVLDYTMDRPSSHGCIRLSIDDARWIYNNIPKGSKIIIK